MAVRSSLAPQGGHETIKVDVRVVAATNRDLGAAATKGEFRPEPEQFLPLPVLGALFDLAQEQRGCVTDWSFDSACRRRPADKKA